MVDRRVTEWQAKFSQLQGSKDIVSLTGKTSTDLRLLEKGDVIVCSRCRYVALQPLFDVVLILHFLVGHPIKKMAPEKTFKALELVGGEVGPTYELIISHTRYVPAQTENKTRIVACLFKFKIWLRTGEPS